MSIRTLPEIKAFDDTAGLRFEPEDGAVARWNPAIRGAAEGDAVIEIYDVIGQDYFGDGVSSQRIAGELARIGGRDVTVNINSPGGDFFEGVAIYNLLRGHPHKVTVQVMGLAASAASVIAMAGDAILVPQVGFLMIHNAWAIAIGNRHDMRAAADTLEPFDDAMAGLYASRAGADKAKAAAWMDAETWFNGSQAVDAGLADGLLDPDAVSQADAASAKSLAAVRRIDAALARQGLPRSERKSLLREMKDGKPGAADTAMPGAGDHDIAADLRSLLATMRS